MSAALQRAWLRRGPLACALWPLSLLYRAAAALDRGFYAAGLKPVRRLPVPVIVVGNVIAGGAGKTPVVLTIVQHLRQRGIEAGIVSRGYGRDGGDCLEVRPDADPKTTGDEPLLLRRKSGVPVFVAPRRHDAGVALLQTYPATRVIVSDDGLQHHGLGRDVEVCVFDARGTGNGWLLPAGPLREPWPRAADLVLRPDGVSGIDGFGLQRALAAHAQRADGTQIALSELAGRRVHALAGIASPQSFFAMLRAAGVQPQRTIALPDHHDFADAASLDAGATLVCTEKDAAKLWRVRPDAWAVPLQVQLDAGFLAALDRLLEPRLSSRDGSPPA